MNKDNLVKQLNAVTKERNFLRLGLLGAISVGVLLTIDKVTSDVIVRLVPAWGGESVEVSRTSVDIKYLKMSMRDAVSLYLNATPNNRDYVESTLLELTHPRFHSDLKQKIHQRWSEIQTKQIVTSFHPDNWDVDGETLSGTVSGFLETKIGRTPVGRVKKDIFISYELENGQLLLTGLNEVREE